MMHSTRLDPAYNFNWRCSAGDTCAQSPYRPRGVAVSERFHGVQYPEWRPRPVALSMGITRCQARWETGGHEREKRRDRSQTTERRLAVCNRSSVRSELALAGCGKPIWSVWSFRCLWLSGSSNQTDKTDRIDQTDPLTRQTKRTRQAGGLFQQPARSTARFITFFAVQGLSEMLSPAFFCQDPGPIRHRWLVTHMLTMAAS